MSSFFLESNGIFSCIFTWHFIFSKSFLILLPLQKQHFASLRRIAIPQKEKKMSLLFFSNETAFFHAFLRVISLFF